MEHFEDNQTFRNELKRSDSVSTYDNDAPNKRTEDHSRLDHSIDSTNQKTTGKPHDVTLPSNPHDTADPNNMTPPNKIVDDECTDEFNQVNEHETLNTSDDVDIQIPNLSSNAESPQFQQFTY